MRDLAFRPIALCWDLRLNTGILNAAGGSTMDCMRAVFGTDIAGH